MLSTATVTTIGLTCKAFLSSPLCSVSVNGLSTLLDALKNDQRENGRGVVTIANHISVLDDPVAWGILPARFYLSSRMTRWALGASDIMFTNPVFSAFFRKGQVLETFRGKGIYQPAVDKAIQKLNEGAWIHLFGEGKVNQPETYVKENGLAHLQRFKWGVGRILMETKVPPVIIPMWLTGFDKLMPEHRPFPYKFLPRMGINLSVTFGEPLPAEDIRAALRRTLPDDGMMRNSEDNKCRGAWTGKAVEARYPDINGDERIRREVTAVLQRAVEALGRRVSGDLLSM